MRHFCDKQTTKKTYDQGRNKMIFDLMELT